MASMRVELTDAQWARIEPLLPSSAGKRGRPFRDSRQVVAGCICKFRTGVSWRDVPDNYGPWKTLWKRHVRYSADGTWERVWFALMAEADAAGELDWMIAADSSMVRVHQHGATARRWDDAVVGVTGDAIAPDDPDLEVVVEAAGHTGG